MYVTLVNRRLTFSYHSLSSRKLQSRGECGLHGLPVSGEALTRMVCPLPLLCLPCSYQLTAVVMPVASPEPDLVPVTLLMQKQAFLATYTYKLQHRQQCIVYDIVYAKWDCTVCFKLHSVQRAASLGPEAKGRAGLKFSRAVGTPAAPRCLV